jgi:hypothetical protein
LNVLFLLEGRSTSFITISYSDFIPFGTWLGFAGEVEPSEWSQARQS